MPFLSLLAMIVAMSGYTSVAAHVTRLIRRQIDTRGDVKAATEQLKSWNEKHPPSYWTAESRSVTIERYRLATNLRAASRKGIVGPALAGIFWPFWCLTATAHWVLSTETRRVRRDNDHIESLKTLATEAYVEHKDRVSFWTDQLERAANCVEVDIAEENLRFLDETAPPRPPETDEARDARHLGEARQLARLRRADEAKRHAEKIRAGAIQMSKPSPADLTTALPVTQAGLESAATRQWLRDIKSVMITPPAYLPQPEGKRFCAYCGSTKPLKEFSVKGRCDDCLNGLWT